MEPQTTTAGTGNALWNDAKETARSKFSEQQQAAAGSLGDFAGALRKSAEQLQGGEHQSAARFAQTAANGLEQLSGALRNRDLDGMLRDAESFARRQPALFFGAAALAGFFAVRFLKSSHSSDTESTGTPMSTSTPMSTINPMTEI
jgi:hypothetical protein